MEPGDIRAAMIRCVRCGQCRSVCPVFLVKKVESDSTRGRVTLIRALLEGEISFSEELGEKVWQCLLCHSCSQECPSGVQVEKIILAARSKMAELRGLPFSKKVLIQGLLPNLKSLSKLMALGRFLQSFGGKEVPGGYWLPSFSLPLFSSRVLPRLNSRSLFQMVPSEAPFIPRPKGRAVFYAGCMLAYGYPRTGKAVVEVLYYNGIEVVIPPDQVCCGLPALASGHRETFTRLREANLRVLKRVKADGIVTACPSCGSTLKEYYSSELQAKIFDFSEFLVAADFKPPDREWKSVVTYHDPCHLRKAQKVVRPPRRILASIPGIKFKEAADPGRCCGFGGTFGLYYPGLSREIGRARAGSLLDTGAEAVVTSCPGCMLQLADSLYRQQSTVPVRHLAEVLAEAYGFHKPLTAKEVVRPG